MVGEHREHDGDDEAGEQDLVRDDLVLEVGQRDDEQRRDEGAAERDQPPVVLEAEVDGDEGRGEADLAERVAGRDRRAAVPASAPQQQPGEHRDVVVAGDLLLAVRAPRALADHQFSPTGSR